MKVSVTAEDIANGHRGAAFSCPIARAVNRAKGWVTRAGPSADTNVTVTTDKICLWNDDAMVYKWPTTEPVMVFINQYDLGKKVEPFEFEMEGADAA